MLHLQTNSSIFVSFFLVFQDISLNNQTNVSQILGSSVANLSISNLADNIRFSIRNPGEPQIDPQVRLCFQEPTNSHEFNKKYQSNLVKVTFGIKLHIETDFIRFLFC